MSESVAKQQSSGTGHTSPLPLAQSPAPSSSFLKQRKPIERESSSEDGPTLGSLDLPVSSDVANGDRSSDTSTVTMRDLLRRPIVAHFTGYLFFYIVASFMPGVFLAAYGASYFGGCYGGKGQKHRDSDGDCKLDYVSWQFWSSLIQSLRGVVSFLLIGMIGRVSDAYGRKELLGMHIAVNSLPLIPLLFGKEHIWWYLVLSLLMGLNGSNASATPIMTAYLADILTEDQRTLGYALVYSSAGLGLFVGGGLSAVIGALFSDYGIIVSILVIYVLGYTHLRINVVESLSPSKRKPLKKENLVNPLRPLLQTKDNLIVLYISLVQFLISLPETGIIDNIGSYILDQLRIDDEKTANLYILMFLVSFGCGLVTSMLVIMPYLKSNRSLFSNNRECHPYSDLDILFFGASIMSFALFLVAMISVFKSTWIVVLSGFVLSCGLISFPAANGIVSRFVNSDEQGLAFGTVFGWRGLTFILAPFSFGALYKVCKPLGMPWAPAMFACLMCTLSLPVIKGPLKRAVSLYESMRIGQDGGQTAGLTGVTSSKIKKLQAMSIGNLESVADEDEDDVMGFEQNGDLDVIHRRQRGESVSMVELGRTVGVGIVDSAAVVKDGQIDGNAYSRVGTHDSSSNPSADPD